MEIRNYFELNRNKLMAYQNLCDVHKVAFEGKVISLHAYIREKPVNHLHKYLFQ